MTRSRSSTKGASRHDFSSQLSVVKQHPIITFFVLSYAIAWGFVPFGLLRGVCAADRRPHRDPRNPGRRGTQGARLADDPLAREVVLVRGGPGLPLAVHLAIVGLNVAAGAGFPSLTFASLTTFLMVFAVRLVNPADGPLGEHPGWNGVALPGLQASYSPLLATAILAPLVAGWHLPTLLHGGGRLAAVRPRGRPRGDHGGDVLVRVAVQPHRRQHTAGRHRARRRREHPVPRSAGSTWACGWPWRSGWSSSTGRPGVRPLRRRRRPCLRYRPEKRHRTAYREQATNRAP